MSSENLNILFITGSYPPRVCGVGDYTFKLLDFFKKRTERFNFDIFYKADWSIKYFRAYLAELKKIKPDFYHMQYPTEGYGYSFVPLFLFVFLPRKKTIVTVHELSSRNISAYIYTKILIMFSGVTIVSNELEREHACKFLLNKKKVKVIPIASNIKVSEYATNKFSDRPIDLAYFGHIRPIKGIEEFILTVSKLPVSSNTAIIGQSLERYEEFFEGIVSEAKRLNINVIANKGEDEIADILAKVKIMYLPFPDGVSNRRGSLLASIQNGCVIVTTTSHYEEFNVFFGKYCFLLKSNEDASDIIRKILKEEIELKDMSDIILKFSWDAVMEAHFTIYDKTKS